MIDMDTRLRVARGIAKTETVASVQVFQTLKRRGHPDAPPPTVSDGWGDIDEAMIEVYGSVPEYQGVGRPPTRQQAQPGWQYVQVIKQRENGRVVGTEFRVIFGDEKRGLGITGQEHSPHRTHTSDHATFQWPLDTQDACFLQATRDV